MNKSGWQSTKKNIKQIGLAFYSLATFYLLVYIFGQAPPITITILELYLFVGFNLLFGIVWVILYVGSTSAKDLIKEIGLLIYCVLIIFVSAQLFGEVPIIYMGELYIFIGFNLLFGIGWGSWYMSSSNQIIKGFYADPETALSIVRGVLQQKSFPYESRKKNRFVIPTENGEIVIKVLPANRGAMGITISPTTPENMPLIESLCAKLDEAFTPRGLKTEEYHV